MPRRSHVALAATLAIAAATGSQLFAKPKAKPEAKPAALAPADVIKVRHEGFKEMGAAFKSVMDGMRGDPQIILIQQSARTIKARSQDIYRWFPAGSGPQRGVKTHAKAEVWTKPAEFRTAQDNLGKAADALLAAANSGDAKAIGATLRPLGGACKGCHDKFRVPEEHDHS